MSSSDGIFTIMRYMTSCVRVSNGLPTLQATTHLSQCLLDGSNKANTSGRRPTRTRSRSRPAPPDRSSVCSRTRRRAGTLRSLGLSSALSLPLVVQVDAPGDQTAVLVTPARYQGDEAALVGRVRGVADGRRELRVLGQKRRVGVFLQLFFYDKYSQEGNRRARLTNTACARLS